MAKKDEGFISFSDVGLNNIDDAERERKSREFLKGANMSTTKLKAKNKSGRKKKAYGEKAVETMVVYFTAEQKEIIQAYCDKIPIPFSTLVKQMLSEKGVI